MSKWLFRIPVLLAYSLLAAQILTAQEVVHALTGTVNSIDSASKTFSVTTDDGSVSVFDQMTGSHKSSEVEKALRNGAVAAGAFNQSGAHVILYYTGWGDPRTAVAFLPIGAGPFTVASGTVVKFDKGDHTLTIKEPSGTVGTFKLAQDTVAETGTGAMESFKFDLAKGQQVRVTSTQVNGIEKPVFIYAAFAN